jgi:predicted nucleic acid-binding protein
VKRFAIDTSCLVAAVCSWHEQHDTAAAAIERRLQRGERLTIAAHALLESYAVLTRLPAPHRLAPADAWTLIRANFVEGRDVSAVEPAGYVELITELAAAGIAGGRSYDELIARCALQSNAAVLLTLNGRHFQPAPDGLAIEEPR